MSKLKKYITSDQFKKWSYSFTAHVLRLITVFWFICMLWVAIIFTLTLFVTGELPSLDIFITEICHCFMAGVVTGLVTRVVGNVFEFNNGSFMGQSITKESEEDDDASEDEY